MKGPVRIALTVAALFLCAAPAVVVLSLPALAASATPTPAAPAAINLGVSAGDAYCISGVGIDEPRGLAYVSHSNPGNPQESSISVVDLQAGQVKRVFPLRPPFNDPRLDMLVSPNGNYLYFAAAEGNARLDVRTGATVKTSVPALGVLFNEDRSFAVLRSADWLKVYRTADFFSGKAPLWEKAALQPVTSGFQDVAISGDRIALAESPWPRSPALVVFDLASGKELARAAPPRPPENLLPGPGGGFALLFSGRFRERLIARYDADLALLSQAQRPLWGSVVYDREQQRYLINGALPDDATWNSAGYLVALDARELKETARTKLEPGPYARTLIPYRDRIIAYTSDCDASRLDVYDRQTLQLRKRIPTGVRLTAVAIDDAAGRLYVTDSHFRTHVISQPEGKVIAIWDGGAPLTLDAANHRLYVNTGTEVRALDTRSGALVARFGQYGQAAPDAARNIVYIAYRGVTMYDLAGRRVGQLEGTLPDLDFSIMTDQPYAVGAVANPVTGHLAVLTYRGKPYGDPVSSLRIFAPGAGPITHDSGDSNFVVDVTTDAAGHWYVSYGFPGMLTAVDKLAPNGTRLARLGGRTGHLAVDEAKRSLYVAEDNGFELLPRRRPDDQLTRLALSDMTMQSVSVGVANTKDMVYSERTRVLHVIDDSTPLVHALSTGALPPIDTRPGPVVSPIPTPGYAHRHGRHTFQDLLPFDLPRGRGLIASRGAVFRTLDGVAWQELLPATGLTYAVFAAPRPDVVLLAGSGSTAAGVWRSKDRGESWEPLFGGLSDLWVWNLQASGPNDIYAQNGEPGLLRWDEAAAMWRKTRGALPCADNCAVSLAPDGALFVLGRSALFSSRDRGETWERLPPPGATPRAILGFAAPYTETTTMIAQWVDRRRGTLMRSHDGGLSWQEVVITKPLPVGNPAQMTSARGLIYLLLSEWNGPPEQHTRYLLRSADNGSTWEMAPSGLADTFQRVEADPSTGFLWIGEQSGARRLDPDTVEWTRISGPRGEKP